MYLRATQRQNRDGSVVRYVQLAHNRRVEGVTQAEVLVNLGREDRLDVERHQRGPTPNAESGAVQCPPVRWFMGLNVAPCSPRRALGL
jgi:hypothetical protein